MMFSIVVYAFSAFVCWYSGRHFFRAWQKRRQQSHWEFGMFFYWLAAGLLANVLVGVSAPGLLASLLQELSDFLTLISFGFVLRACIRFQNLSVSFGVVNAVILISVLARLFIGVPHLSNPVVQGGLIYTRYSFLVSVVQGALIIVFTLLVAVTLLSNLKNLQQKKRSVLLLGLAFILGGVGGALVGMNDFVPILAGHLLLSACFILPFFLITRVSSEP
ncbi:hypothetical protein A3C91_04000 [Candidatus Azambacteria bacterium RIFCSPHIGHO2_02_FULL_52_12]|uniref:Uncharacterized protein n=1 Tax=Candidatus Azambacteria bacterium RIFCSPLOWO2_01_FULL_46_25 TaxID=1797298 RepID=A0A1F5BUW4_9BACT|nr:MAG: hypothetical protein A3C91_04000 [Candidatus Azambacteria bacterium RIFCSPHIGHO2_02_FULL_52_12]OGD34400.1 MAG: hypothetical protein A2988_02635 [Candidatus Azambacteria bacterium RIFCSPLOWO2_01_FULL_46_25]OGD37322.1 MAG: hypothetical protein A2850_01255 [Candidatus Azambacteria bacterium RIFCSPHIGHO2_01_FULL_51_74]